MSDEFSAFARTPSTPSEQAYAVQPSDLAPLPTVPKYLYVGSGGSVTLRAMDSEADVVFESVPAGGYLFVRASHVRSTGTTAGAIVACA